MTMKNLAARRRGHVKILIRDSMLPQLAYAVVYDYTVTLALVCHDRYGHIIYWSRESAYQHCLLRILSMAVAYIPIQLDARAICPMVVQRVVEERLCVLATAQDT